MDGEEQHDVRELPPDAAHGGRVRRPHHITGRLHRRVLPRGVGPVGVPDDHAPAHWGPHGAHDIRVRGDEPGWGSPVMGRAYREYQLESYSPWLRKRVLDNQYWLTIRSCILRSKACDKIALWTPFDYLTKDLTPIQSGCCKPPTWCNYAAPTTVPQDPDCYRWNNAAAVLCYECESCKAGCWRTCGGAGTSSPY